jgi:hypothetical protein
MRGSLVTSGCSFTGLEHFSFLSIYHVRHCFTFINTVADFYSFPSLPLHCVGFLFVSYISNVYNYCTSAKPNSSQRGKTTSGATFIGEELYVRTNDFLKKHVKGLLKVRKSISKYHF